MEKITLSLHDASLKEKIKSYAKKRGLTVSAIVENYLKNLVKSNQKSVENYPEIPHELDLLLEGIEVSDEYKAKDYKTLRDEAHDIKNR